MTPEKGLLKIKQLSQQSGWNFAFVHENLPPRMVSDKFLIRLASGNDKAINDVTEFLKNLFNPHPNSGRAACK